MGRCKSCGKANVTELQTRMCLIPHCYMRRELDRDLQKRREAEDDTDDTSAGLTMMMEAMQRPTEATSDSSTVTNLDTGFVPGEGESGGAGAEGSWDSEDDSPSSGSGSTE